MRWTGNKVWLAGGLFVRGVGVAERRRRRLVRHREPSPSPAHAPTLRPLDMAADPACAKKHTTPVPNEMLVLGTGNTMGNIIVWVSKGLPAGKTYPAPTTPVIARSERLPVQAARDGDHGRPALQDPQLRRHPPQRSRAPQDQRGLQQADAGDGQGGDRRSSTRPEAVFKIKCDVHPWMNAYVGVFDHPFYAVTGPDGKFTISGPRRGDLRDHRLAREAGDADGLGHGWRHRVEDPGLQVRHARREVAIRRPAA